MRENRIVFQELACLSRVIRGLLISQCLFLTPVFSLADTFTIQDNNTCVVGGSLIVGTVTISHFDCPFPAPNPCLPAVVELSSSHPAIVSVPATVTVNPPGQPNAGETSFNITVSRAVFPVRVTITARHRGDTGVMTVNLGVLPCEGCLIESYRLDPTSVLGGAIVEATVRLACPTPLRVLQNPGGLNLDVSSSDPVAQPVNAAGEPISTVYIRPGLDTATFTVRTFPVLEETLVALRVSDGERLQTRTLRVQPGSLDLFIRKMEITQAIQYLDHPGFADNSLPLFKGKATAVRVYLQSNLDTNSTLEIRHVPVQLQSRLPGSGDSGWKNHAPLWPSATLHPGRSIQEQRESPSRQFEIDRGPLNATFLIDPLHLKDGQLEFRAEVNAGGLITETNTKNNVLTYGPVTFLSSPSLNVKFLKIDWCPGCPGDSNPRLKPEFGTYVPPIVAYLEKVFPVERVKYWQASMEINTSRFGPSDFSKNFTWTWVLDKMAILKLFTDDEAPQMHYYALLHPSVPRVGGPSGMAFTDKITCQGLIPVPFCSAGVATRLDTAAQEISHNKGRCHAPCPWAGEDGAPDDIDPNWPAGLPRGIIGDTGFDVDTHLALPGSPHPGQTASTPGIYHDFMGYCGNDWVSSYTYNSLWLEMAQASSLEESQGSESIGPSVDHIVVRGIIDELGQVQLSPFYRKDFSSGLYDDPGQGCHSIVLLDAEGQVLRNREFDPRTTRDEQAGPFIEVLPIEPGTVRIDIMNNCAVGGPLMMATCPVTENNPVVSVIAPNGGEMLGVDEPLTVAWTASDPDEDGLTYMVQFSGDGGLTWKSLAVDLEESSAVLESSDLPGTTNGLIRVMASDGVNLGQDVSDLVFSVPRKLPAVAIISPLPGVVSEVGTSLALHGTASDAEDGPLPEESLTWISDRDGILGSGSELVVDLTEGEHELRLEGRDADGNVVTDQVRIVRLESGVPYLVGAHIEGGFFEFRFKAEEGQEYVVERRDSLSSGAWEVWTNVVPPSVTTNLVIRDLLDSGQRFYRLRKL